MNQQTADKIASKFEDKTNNTLDGYFKDEGWGYVYGLDNGGIFSVNKSTGAVTFINDQDEEVGSDSLAELLAYIPTTDDEQEEEIPHIDTNTEYEQWLLGIEEVANAQTYLRKAYQALSVAETHFAASGHSDLEKEAKRQQVIMNKASRQINHRFELDL